jgi:hypothetical protein
MESVVLDLLDFVVVAMGISFQIRVGNHIEPAVFGQMKALL